jgi:hypothetical protein
VGLGTGEHHADAVGCEGGVEASRVLGVAVADQELERPTLGQADGEVPGLLGVLNLVYGPAESTGHATYEDAKVHLSQPEQ